MLPKIITFKFYALIKKVVENSMISLLETISQLHLLQMDEHHRYIKTMLKSLNIL